MRFASFVIKMQSSAIKTNGLSLPVISTFALLTTLLFLGGGMAGRAHAQDDTKSDQYNGITSNSKSTANVDAKPGSEQNTAGVNQDASQSDASNVNKDAKQSANPTDNPIQSRDINKVFDSSIPAAEFATRHPLGSVSSVAGADNVLTDVTKARAEVELRTLNEQRVCYKKFFTNPCLNAAKEQRRLALKQIRPLEVEANAYKRRATADDRDKALAEQQTKNDISAPKLQQDQKEKESSIANKVKESGEKDAAVTANTKLHAGEAEKRISDNANKLNKIQQNETAKASERAANRAAFIKKGQDAAARQREVADKKAEKARDLAEKKASAVPAVSPPAVTSPSSAPAPAQP
ncbi:hypothetical protein QN379_18480 [Glaciimonas sp. Gout2]|uniref:hypothetical protein n=1 Tax=unclassified Glaciimonas TaxID=2644401 RepID=UPI002AB3F261|nr:MULTISPECIES: hypothetical protein [unclassified Glaciimonas]MDY7548398.1 hypothetical protein [Glaciimonas sp. CA11.2]MEB0010452.1 hypothetical protein [Glaciimonas sp. Cout2]MEB0083997.1 hypothetical protein [Glaciimonas sp. Gout2]